MQKISGIYKIQSICKPERIYIGSAVCIDKRWRDHLCGLKQNQHHSIKLQRHYNKYGLTDLVFSIVLGCNKSDLLKTEQYFIDSYNPWFNICKTAGSVLGKICSEETRRKIGNANKGKISSMKGKHHSEETKEKQRKALLGLKHSKERRINNSKGHKGLKHSEESNHKGSESRKGHIVTKETREKIRKSLTGKRHTEERRINNVRGHLGQKSWNKGKKGIYSEETRRRISESHKGRKAWNKGLKFMDGHYICQN